MNEARWQLWQIQQYEWECLLTELRLQLEDTQAHARALSRAAAYARAESQALRQAAKHGHCSPSDRRRLIPLTVKTREHRLRHQPIVRQSP
jgi:hypothetical protein